MKPTELDIPNEFYEATDGYIRNGAILLRILEEQGWELVQPVEGMCFVNGQWHQMPEVHTFVSDGASWFLEHSVACRMQGLENCELHRLCNELDDPPVGNGRYLVEVGPLGELVFAEEKSDETD